MLSFGSHKFFGGKDFTTDILHDALHVWVIDIFKTEGVFNINTDKKPH